MNYDWRFHFLPGDTVRALYTKEDPWVWETVIITGTTVEQMGGTPPNCQPSFCHCCCCARLAHPRSARRPQKRTCDLCCTPHDVERPGLGVG